MISDEFFLFFYYVISLKLLYLSNQVLKILREIISSIFLISNIILKPKSVDYLVDIDKKNAFDFFIAQSVHDIVELYA